MTEQMPSTAVLTASDTAATSEPTRPAAEASTGTSLRDQLRAARKRAANRQTQDFQIPGYDPPLWGTFRAMDEYSDVRKFVAEHDKVVDEAEKELLIGADTLAASCTGVYVMVDGVRGELDLPPQGFTPAMAAYLVTETDAEGNEIIDPATGEPKPVAVDNNRQAVLAIFPNTVSVMTLFAEIDMWFKKAGVVADEETAGNSPAPS